MALVQAQLSLNSFRGSGWKNSLTLLLLAAFLAGCNNNESGSSESASLSTPESPACTAAQNHSGGITIQSVARYTRFNDGSSGLVTQATLPIRYGEIQILNGAGNQVSCGWTDESGNVSLSMPRAPGTFTLKVNSRSFSDQVRASILADVTSNRFFSIQQNFSVGGGESSVSVGLPTATSSGSLEGGAFNILDQIVNANSYLRTNVSGFGVAPKVTIYWSPGLSPGAYYGSPTDRISFFNSEASPGFPQALYILGGVNGSVCTDTDHFDNSVILHEYAHFLEFAFSKSDSPGGAHNGSSAIDPRLAWSEGWANFFQGAVLGRNFYRDTTSNIACGGAMLSFPDFSLESKNADVPTATAEGTFREFSISRTLYDILGATDTDGYTANLGFNPIWNAFASTSSGLANPARSFRNMSMFLQDLTPFIAAGAQSTQFTSILANEYQQNAMNYYGGTLNPSASACANPSPRTFLSSTSAAVRNEGASQSLVNNNRFYRYNYDGSAARQVIQLSGSPAPVTGYDLDIYVYRERHVLTDTRTIVAQANSVNSSNESVSLAGQPAGTYLIRVTAVFPGSARTNTELNLNLAATGEYLCTP